MASITLESIPTELWKDIATLACTDGGYTGRSLALTSKFVHTQSWPWRLHSVALTSLQDLENLLVFLRTAERQPSIEHLYLSFANESTIKPPPDLWTTYWCLSEEERETYNDKSGRAKQAWDARFAPAITEMLALAGPTLRTLCIIEERPVRLPSFTHGVFPKLEELTLHGYILPIFPVDQVKAALSKSRPPAQPLISELSARLPALQRLHLVHTSGRRLSSSDAVNCIAYLAPPNLTHLRLSDVHRGAILSWEVMVGGADLDEIDAWESMPMKLPRISQVIAHGCRAAPGGESGIPDSGWDDFCNDLEAFARRCERVWAISVLHMMRPWRRDRRWKERLRKDWMGRIEGRDGCWVQSEEEEAAREAEVCEDGLPTQLPEVDDDL